jgi:hypothetical protein
LVEQATQRKRRLAPALALLTGFYRSAKYASMSRFNAECDITKRTIVVGSYPNLLRALPA